MALDSDEEEETTTLQSEFDTSTAPMEEEPLISTAEKAQPKRQKPAKTKTRVVKEDDGEEIDDLAMAVKSKSKKKKKSKKK